ncbi:MAG: smalltalk protein [Bacteroidaceae bacterium]
MLWRTIINVVVAALSAIATALGVTSCMGLGPM